jgi:Ca-activated chloride channel family protein
MIFPFARPLLLLLLVIPAWLIIRNWRRTSGRLVLPFDHSGSRSSRWWAGAIRVAESLPPLLLAVALLLLAGPQQLAEPLSRRKLTNIEFCVDISGSMTAPFGEGSRYDASMAAINRFVDYRTGDAFGLTFFGNNFLHFVPLTTDVSAIKCAPPFMRPENAPPGFGGTEIGKALLACRTVLEEREEGDRMIILISDGQSSDLTGNRSVELAGELKESGVVVHAIHVAETGLPNDIVNITGLTGGGVFGVDDPAALDYVFQQIDQMQQTEMIQLAPDRLDHFAPYCLAGLSLLGLVTMCLFGLRFTPW